MSRLLLSCLLCCLILPVQAAETLPGKPIEAVTANGDKVVLHPNGRWEFLDTGKAQAAKEIAKQYPENQGCPPGWQGGLCGIGRCISPDDPAYVRGSRSGK